MVKGFFGNLKKVWRCRRNFGGAGRKTHIEKAFFHSGVVFFLLASLRLFYCWYWARVISKSVLVRVFNVTQSSSQPFSFYNAKRYLLI